MARPRRSKTQSKSQPTAVAATEKTHEVFEEIPLVQPSRTTRTAEIAFEGPIPPPDMLHRYNQIIPNAAERILAMAENENRHRHDQDNKALEANIAAQRYQLDIANTQSKLVFRSDLIGQILGWIISCACIAGSIYLTIIGWPYVAVTLLGLPLAAIIKALRGKSK
jgi:uncharacterized membrane protein